MRWHNCADGDIRSFYVRTTCLKPKRWRIGCVAQEAPGGDTTPLDAVLAAERVSGKAGEVVRVPVQAPDGLPVRLLLVSTGAGSPAEFRRVWENEIASRGHITSYDVGPVRGHGTASRKVVDTTIDFARGSTVSFDAVVYKEHGTWRPCLLSNG